MANRYVVWLGAAIVTIAAFSSAARANHFEVTLSLAEGTNEVASKTETDPPKPDEKVADRPVLTCDKNKQLVARWKLTSTAKTPVKEVLVHFFAVKIKKSGQPTPPLEPSDVVIETAQLLDIDPGHTTTGEVKFIFEQPGLYLVRVETQGTTETFRHEHFSALEASVK